MHACLTIFLSEQGKKEYITCIFISETVDALCCPDILQYMYLFSTFWVLQANVSLLLHKQHNMQIGRYRYCLFSRCMASIQDIGVVATRNSFRRERHFKPRFIFSHHTLQAQMHDGDSGHSQLVYTSHFSFVIIHPSGHIFDWRKGRFEKLRFLSVRSDSLTRSVLIQVPLYVNKVGPYFNPQETYHYYSLPVCRPEKVV